MVPLPYLLRDQIGRVGGVRGRASLLAFGPSFLYFSRFAREDIYIACDHARRCSSSCSASSTGRGGTTRR